MPKAKDTSIMTFTIRADLKAELEVMAERTGQPMAVIIRQALDSHITAWWLRNGDVASAKSEFRKNATP